MGNISSGDLRGGMKLLIDGDPCAVLDVDLVKPGKGQAFTRAKVRNLKTGRVVERTFKSSESVESADVVDRSMEYLYNDGEFYHFMEPDTFEQYQADSNAVADAAQWLKEQDVCVVTLYNGAPLTVAPPNHVELEVTETEPGFKGDTAQGATKPATVSTGATVKVPLFIDQGEIIRIDTRTGEYLSRVKS